MAILGNSTIEKLRVYNGITTGNIDGNGGDIIIGNSNNGGYVKLQNVCSKAGSSYWYIDTSGNSKLSTINCTSITGSASGSITGFGTVEGATWNDLADAIEIPENTEELIPGRCYNLSENSCKLTQSLGEMGILGIHSDTYGFIMGKKDVRCIDLAVSGFVLAYVDEEYKSGTPLTCTHDGMLTAASSELLMRNPGAFVGLYYKPERSEEWNGIKVNGRHWVKIK